MLHRTEFFTDITFFPPWKSFNISSRVGLLLAEFPQCSFVWKKSVLFVTGCRILGWWLLSFNTLCILFHFLFPWMVSDEMSAVLLIYIGKMGPPSFSWFFSFLFSEFEHDVFKSLGIYSVWCTQDWKVYFEWLSGLKWWAPMGFKIKYKYIWGLGHKDSCHLCDCNMTLVIQTFPGLYVLAVVVAVV